MKDYYFLTILCLIVQHLLGINAHFSDFSLLSLCTMHIGISTNQQRIATKQNKMAQNLKYADEAGTAHEYRHRTNAALP